ncbi:MAG TPA: hypothetical protein VGF76_13325 [Polyangiaceae bacterium]
MRTGLGPTWTTVGTAFVEVRRPSATPFTLTLRGSFADGGYTDPPQFTNNPRQMRILFSPVLGIYVPLTP